MLVPATTRLGGSPIVGRRPPVSAQKDAAHSARRGEDKSIRDCGNGQGEGEEVDGRRRMGRAAERERGGGREGDREADREGGKEGGRKGAREGEAGGGGVLSLCMSVVV